MLLYLNDKYKLLPPTGGMYALAGRCMEPLRCVQVPLFGPNKGNMILCVTYIHTVSDKDVVLVIEIRPIVLIQNAKSTD